jgi:hypothetical protein
MNTFIACLETAIEDFQPYFEGEIILQHITVVFKTRLSFLTLRALLRKHMYEYTASTLQIPDRFTGDVDFLGEEDEVKYEEDVGQVIPTLEEADKLYDEMARVVDEAKQKLDELRLKLKDFTQPIGDEKNQFVLFNGSTLEKRKMVGMRLKNLTSSLYEDCCMYDCM